MRILFLSTDFKPNSGGIAELGHQLCMALAQRGHEVTVFTCVKEEYNEPKHYHVRRKLPEYPHTTRISPLRPVYVFKWLKSSINTFNQTLTHVNPDVVVCGNYFLFWPNILFSCSRPIFYFFHGQDAAAILTSRIPGRKRSTAVGLVKASGIFCNSRFTADLVRRLLPQAESRPNLSVTGCGYPSEITETNPIESGNAKRHFGIAPECPVILTVARLVERKGIDTVLNALPDIHKNNPDCKYLIIGDGPMKNRLERMANKLSVSKFVIFTGFVSEERREWAYAAGNVFVSPSKGSDKLVEGFGITYLEANAHGLPVIATRTGGIPDAVEHGTNGYLTQPGDSRELANLVSYLLGNPDICKDMAEAGKKRIRDRFNWPRIACLVEKELQNSNYTKSVTDD